MSFSPEVQKRIDEKRALMKKYDLGVSVPWSTEAHEKWKETAENLAMMVADWQSHLNYGKAVLPHITTKFGPAFPPMDRE